MNIDLEDIRTIVNRHPNIRGKNLLHQLEKRRKVEELRGKAEAQHAYNPTGAKLWSTFNWLMGRQ